MNVANSIPHITLTTLIFFIIINSIVYIANVEFISVITKKITKKIIDFLKIILFLQNYKQNYYYEACCYNKKSIDGVFEHSTDYLFLVYSGK